MAVNYDVINLLICSQMKDFNFFSSEQNFKAKPILVKQLKNFGVNTSPLCVNRIRSLKCHTK